MDTSQRIVLAVLVSLGFISNVYGLRCPQCNENKPYCPDGAYRDCDINDKCVNITLNQIVDKPLYIYDCLSLLEHMRSDVPKDVTNGCRPAEPPPYALGLPADLKPLNDTIYCFYDNPVVQGNGAMRFGICAWILLLSTFFFCLNSLNK